MKIGIIAITGRPIGNDKYGVCAPNTVVNGLIKKLVEKKHEVYVFTGEDSNVLGNKVSLGSPSPISLYKDRDEYLNKRVQYDKSLSEEACRFFKQGKVDFVNSHDFRYSRDVFIKNNVRILYTIHEELSFNNERYAPDLLKQVSDSGGGFANISTANNKYCKEFGVNTYGYVPNGIDTDKFTFKNTKRTASVLYVGRVIEGKNITEMIKVSLELGLRISIAGPPGNDKKDKAYFGYIDKNYFQKDDRVNYLGFVDRNKLPEVYSKHKVLLFMSKTEGMPLSILEAMACGTIVVASNVGGVSDIISHKQDGYLLEDDRVETISKGIEAALLIDGKKARAKIEEKFSLNAMASNYVDSFNSFMRASNQGNQ